MKLKKTGWKTSYNYMYYFIILQRIIYISGPTLNNHNDPAKITVKWLSISSNSLNIFSWYMCIYRFIYTFLVPKILYSIQVYKFNIYFKVQKYVIILLLCALFFFSLIKLLEPVAKTACFVKSIELLMSFKVLTIYCKL